MILLSPKQAQWLLTQPECIDLARRSVLATAGNSKEFTVEAFRQFICSMLFIVTDPHAICIRFEDHMSDEDFGKQMPQWLEMVRAHLAAHPE